MNYSENTKMHDRKIIREGKVRKRKKNYSLVIMLVLMVVILVGIGVFIGNAIAEKEVHPYGQIEEMVLTGEMPYPYENGVSEEFIPLDVNMDYKMQEFIYFLSKAYNVDFTLVMAIIDQESGFQPDVVSKTDDFGLMQINKRNHEWLEAKFGITDFLNPFENVNAGVYILKNLFEKYEDPAKVLMAYNIGEYGAAKLWNKGIFESYYSKTVMTKANAFIVQINERSVQE